MCHYWSTTGRNVATANFKPAYIGKSTGKTILTHRLRLNEEPTEMWTGTCDLASFLGKVSFNVDKKGNHRLSGRLARYSPTSKWDTCNDSSQYIYKIRISESSRTILIQNLLSGGDVTVDSDPCTIYDTLDLK